jgi:hypothetical protein
MTLKEKAEEITLKYYNLGKHLYVPISFAKQCALIAVDLILDETIYYFNDDDLFVEYWQEVKQEIEKL